MKNAVDIDMGDDSTRGMGDCTALMREHSPAILPRSIP